MGIGTFRNPGQFATRKSLMTPLLDRIAGAPITWGVDGSPGWGHIMAPDRVLQEMHEAGLKATELGPDGYLPTDPAELSPMLDAYDLALVGAFVPLVLYRHDLIEDQLAYADRAARTLAGAGSKILVLGPASHHDGYDTRITLDRDDWDYFIDNIALVDRICADHGLAAAIHTHFGMAVDLEADVYRLLECSEIGMCLDTGHIYLGGADPVEVARTAGERTVHVHLKDVDPVLGDEVMKGTRPFRQAVTDGLFTPLGKGAVDIAGVVQHLESIGFQGWYVLEQDKALATAPAEGEGPLGDALACMDYLRRLAL